MLGLRLGLLEGRVTVGLPTAGRRLKVKKGLKGRFGGATGATAVLSTLPVSISLSKSRSSSPELSTGEGKKLLLLVGGGRGAGGAGSGSGAAEVTGGAAGAAAGGEGAGLEVAGAPGPRSLAAEKVRGETGNENEGRRKLPAVGGFPI